MEPEPSESAGDPRVYMAAERTFLAWLRTSIALMGFGFVVARFGLFLRELAATGAMAGTAIKTPSAGFSLPVGILLIVLGILVLGGSTFRYQRLIRAIDRGQFRSAFGSAFTLILAGLLAIVGLAVAAYLAVL